MVLLILLKESEFWAETVGEDWDGDLAVEKIEPTEALEVPFRGIILENASWLDDETKNSGLKAEEDGEGGKIGIAIPRV